MSELSICQKLYEHITSLTRQLLSSSPPHTQSKRKHTVTDILRSLYLSAIAFQSIRHATLITKRDVHYMCHTLFPTTATVHTCLNALSKSLGITNPNDLRIIAAPKGLVAGCLSFVDEFDNTVHVHGFGEQGCLLPPRPERIKKMSFSARAVIIIEKETVFRCILDEANSNSILAPYILITGKGFPDNATVQFVNRLLSECGHIPIFLLTDADPHGVLIANTYVNKLPDEANVKWLGLKPNHFKHSLSNQYKIKLTDNEYVLIKSRLKHWTSNNNKNGNVTHFIDAMNEFLVSGYKFELEALAVLDKHNKTGNESSVLLTFIKQSIQKHD